MPRTSPPPPPRRTLWRGPAALLALVVLALCGCPADDFGRVTDDDDATAAPNDDDSADDCVPATCAERAADCGGIDDGCGGTVDCGPCLGVGVCGGGGTPNVCDCATVNDGDTVRFDMQSVRFFIEPTLDGAPVSAANTTADGHPSFALQPLEGSTGVGWDRVVRAAWSAFDGSPQPQIPMRVLPGRYAVWYRHVGPDPDSPWPANSFALVEPVVVIGEEITDGQTLSIDLTPVTLALEVRIGDVAASSLPAPPHPVQLTLRGQASGGRGGGGGGGNYAPPDRVEVLGLGPSDDPAAGPTTLTILPGSYSATWTNQAGVAPDHAGLDGDPWPLGIDARLAPFVIDAADSTLSVTVPAVDLVLEPTLDGAPLSSATLAPDDGVRFLLAGAGDFGPSPFGSAVYLPDAIDAAGAVSPTITARVVPGTWDIQYRSQRDPDLPASVGSSRWPWNRGEVISGANVGSSVTLPVDIQPVAVTLDVTLGGEALTPVNSRADDIGRLLLADNTTQRWPLPPLWAADAVATPYTVLLLPGAWDVEYSSEDRAAMASWPDASADLLLLPGAQLLGDQSIVVDVPVEELAPGVTHNGVAFTPSSLAVPPSIELLVPRNQGQFGGGPGQRMGWLPAGQVVLPLDGSTLARRVVPGQYQVAYIPGDAVFGGTWGDAWYVVDEQASIGATTPLWALRDRRLTVEFALDGEDASPANTSADDHARLFFTRFEPRSTAGFLAGWEEASEPGTAMAQAVRLPPGRYSLQYYVPDVQSGLSLDPAVDLDSRWPVSAGAQAGCVTVQ